MKIGIFWKSYKEHERRYPLYWKHIEQLSETERNVLVFEKGYPGVENLGFEVQTGNREEMYRDCNVLIIPKPTSQDLEAMRINTTLFGWPHSVQGYEITQVAIDKKLTIIAWENMYKWDKESKKEHIFARNNELAGYAAINHFMELQGTTPGLYGDEMKIAVLGFGSTAKGAINSLLGLGATNITVFSKRNRFEIVDSIKNVSYRTYTTLNNDVLIDNNNSSEELQKFDLIVNCVLQDPLKPLIFFRESDLKIKKKKIMIIDVSCDYKMGFDFARSTSFEQPIIETEKYIYYAVDHTPTYYWNSASVEISGALLPYLKHFINNNGFQGNIVLEKAVDIASGVIKNSKIIDFQHRENTYPHKIVK